MPYKDPQRQRDAMRRWRTVHKDQIRTYNTNERPPLSPAAVERRYAQRQAQYTRDNGPTTFVGCDGEGMGGGYDHRFYVWRMGTEELITGNPLEAEECLRFIASQPHGPIYVIFSGNYDFTMILRSAPEDFVRDLLNRDARVDDESGSVRPARWGKLRVDYIPHKRLSVRYENNPAIVIHDVFGFFQSSFVKAIDEWNVGTDEHRRLIVAGKERRGSTDVLSAEDREYNRIECVVLAELMTKLDETVKRITLSASPYEGAGALASSLLSTHIAKPIRQQNKVMAKRGGQEEAIFFPDAAIAHGLPTWDAYYGGRFEITAHGPIGVPVYEYDINSAYPAAIRDLPCLHHGTWIEQGRSEPGNARNARPTLGFVRWDWPDGFPFGPLPHRNKQGNVTFPLSGAGWYWSVEWPEWGCVVDKAYEWKQTCDHRPFAWIEARYAQRRAHKQAGRTGEALALKLGYNSVYGKLVQSVGKAPWRNSVLGGLITATCRRSIRDAALQSPDDIVMFATDGIYSLSPLELKTGTELGEWEAHTYEDGLHMVRPGIYFSPDGIAKIKTRGIGQRTVQEHAQEIIRSFYAVDENPQLLWDATAAKEWGTDLSHNGLVSIRLAYAQNKPERAGYVGTLPHRLSYSIYPKRQPLSRDSIHANRVDGILRSAPPTHGIPYESVGYRKGPLGTADEDDAIASAPDRSMGTIPLF